MPGTAPAELVVKVDLLGPRQPTEAVAGSIRDGGAIVDVASTAGCNGLERRELLATDTFDEGLAWFTANPQAGNAYGHDIGAGGRISRAVLSGTAPAPPRGER